MGPDREMTRREVAKFSWRDAEALPRYEAMLERLAAFIEPTLLMTPPNPWSRSPRDLLGLAQLGLRFARLGREGARAVEIFTGPPHASSTDGSSRKSSRRRSPPTPSSGPRRRPPCRARPTCCFHHVMGECDGVRGVWGYVRGGMGGLSTALAAAARAYGAQVRVQAEVRHILVRDGRVCGVALADGTEIPAAVVVSSCDPRVTFVEPLILPSCRRTSGRTSSA